MNHRFDKRLIAVWLGLNMVKAFLPLLVLRPEAHIANVSSMGAFLPVPGQSIYCATKAAVRLLTEGLYAELLDTPVGVSVIMPGAVGTQIGQNSGVETPIADTEGYPTTSPAVAARTILRCIEKDRLCSRVENRETQIQPMGPKTKPITKPPTQVPSAVRRYG